MADVTDIIYLRQERPARDVGKLVRGINGLIRCGHYCQQEKVDSIITLKTVSSEVCLEYELQTFEDEALVRLSIIDVPDLDEERIREEIDFLKQQFGGYVSLAG